MRFDETDLKILLALQTNARISNQDLAQRVGISSSPCLRRVRRLEQEGVIQRYVTLLNAHAVERSLEAFVEIRLEHQNPASVEMFEAEIQKHPEILECYLMAGEWDYLLRVAVKDLEELCNFHMNKLAKVPCVSNLKSNVCLRRVKYSTELLLQP
jgi:Lrp/AsnC family leucine-responsive transcriptional regulator